MKIDHVARAQKAWPLLVAQVNLGKGAFTYKELCFLIKGEPNYENGLHHRAASHLLGVIQKYCHYEEIPPLQSFAVNAGTRLPGGGYWYARDKNSHREAMDMVRKHGKKWALIAPEDLGKHEGKPDVWLDEIPEYLR